MFFGGTDVGSLTAQAVLLENGRIVGYKNIRVLPNPIESAKKVMGELLEELGLNHNDIIIFLLDMEERSLLKRALRESMLAR